MSFPSIPSGEGEFPQQVSQSGKSSSKSNIFKASSKSRQTAEKTSSAGLRSILKQESKGKANSRSKQVGFSEKSSVIYFEKYLPPLGDEDPEDHEGEEDDLDIETQRNTLYNERRDFGGSSDSTKESSSKISLEGGGQSSEDIVEERSGAVNTSGTSSPEETGSSNTSTGMRIRGVFRRVTANINSVGNRVRNLLTRISDALAGCWRAIRSNQNENDEIVLVSHISYDPGVSSTSVEALSD